MTLSEIKWSNCIDGVMVIVLASSAVDRVFEPMSGQTEDFKIGFSSKHATLRIKSNDLMTRNRNDVSE
jgi:hypothetical protein